MNLREILSIRPDLGVTEELSPELRCENSLKQILEMYYKDRLNEGWKVYAELYITKLEAEVGKFIEAGGLEK